eukprot:1690256-Rhodomonas_salina.1
MVVPCGVRYWHSVWCHAVYGTDMASGAIQCAVLTYGMALPGCVRAHRGYPGTAYAPMRVLCDV